MLQKFSRRSSSVSLSGIRKIAEYAKGLHNVIFLNIGEPEFTTPDSIREAAKKAIDEGFTHYSPMRGFPELRNAIAEKLRNENGIDANPSDDILVTSGTQPAFFAVCQALINRGDEVIVQDPFYPSYEVALGLAGAKIVRVFTNEAEGFAINPEDVEAKVTKKTKMIVLISPNNPTGNVLDKHRLKEISEIALDHDLIVVSDELYEKITYDGVVSHSIGSIPGMENRTVTLNGFSKSYAMAGWRVGFVVAYKELIEHLVKIHNTMNICACAVSQKAALAALTSAEDYVIELVKEYDGRRREIVKRLNEIPGFKCDIPKGTFYVFPNTKAFGMSSMELAKFLIERAGVVTVPGSAFGKNGEGHLRLSFAASLEKIRDALLRIEKSVNSFSNWLP